MIFQASLADIVASRTRRQLATMQRPSSDFRRGGSTVVAQPSVGSIAQFDALNGSPNRTPVPTTIYESYGFLLGQSYSDALYRESLCGLARYLADNYGGVWYALSQLFTYSTPMVPRAASKDSQWNKDAEALFDEWALSNADFYGISDFWTLQQCVSIAIDTDGDIGAVMDGTQGIPQIRFIPSWRIGGRFPGAGKPGVADGVYRDALGRVVGYEVRETKDTVAKYSRDEMILLFERDRIDRIRGMSSLRRGANDIRDANDIKSFEKIATKLESAIGGVIEGQAPIASDWEDPENTSAGMAEATTPRSVAVAQMLGGEIPVIDGQFKQLTSNRPGTNKVDFLDTLAGQFVAGLGIPPAFFLDQKNTGPGWRAVIGKAQRRFDCRKRVLATLARWTWQRVIANAVATGTLGSVEGWQKVRVQGPPIITIDLGDQAKADREAVGSGLMSRQLYHGNAGADWQDETDQIIDEDTYLIERLKMQSKQTGVPLDLLLTRHGFQPQQQQQQAQNADTKPNTP